VRRKDGGPGGPGGTTGCGIQALLVGVLTVLIVIGCRAPVHYTDCDAARAAGAAPLHRGDPGYRSALDRDGDGVACR
jgi:hypothetical protein